MGPRGLWYIYVFFFFSSRRRHTRCSRDWSSDVCSSDLTNTASYIIKGNVPRVRERLLKVPMSQVLISAITEAELLFGAARKREAVRLKTAIEIGRASCRERV